MVNFEDPRPPNQLFPIYITILLKYNTFICQIAQLEKLNNCSLTYEEMIANGKVRLSLRS